MIGCSPTQRESNPKASAFCATTAGSIGCGLGDRKIPMFMGTSFQIGEVESTGQAVWMTAYTTPRGSNGKTPLLQNT
jgi:hypothetical protein